MARLFYSEAFIEDITGVELTNKRDEIFERVDLLADFPDLGSLNVPDSIRMRFGDSVRKLVISPFDVLYEYDRASESVHILGLVHQRAAF